MPRVSVIMPAYNGEAYIAEAIASIRAQTLLDWELIVVDDGSTDRTAEIVRSIPDPRIRLVGQANAGEAAARNTGLRSATGELVAFLDADDLYLPEALASNAAYLDRHPEVGVVYADGYFCDPAGRELSRLSDHRAANVVGDVLDTIVVTPLLNASCCAMIRRAAIERQGLRFDPSLVLGCDWQFFIRLAEQERFGYQDRAVCRYRIHASGVTTARSERRRADLGQIRLWAWQAPLYQRLGAKARYLLAYQLLFDAYGDQPERQRWLLSTEPFAQLPQMERSTLLRLVAAHWIEEGWPADTARQYLEAARAACPGDRKNEALRLALLASPALARGLLRARNGLRSLAAPTGAASPFAVHRAEGKGA